MGQDTSSIAPGEADVHQSTFFCLPRELREIIYDNIFCSTKIAFGSATKPEHACFLTPGTPHPLALLQVCRRMHDEVGNRWLGQVLFRFTDPVVMYNVLHVLPTETLSQIRHVRLLGNIDWGGIIVHDPVDEYQVAAMLRLLPGLQLDIFEMLAPPLGDIAAYHTLDGLIEYSDGWRELRYISATSELLAGSSLETRIKIYWRNPQPQHWLSVMRRRDGDGDGNGDGPSVVIYRGNDPAEKQSVFDKETRTLLEQISMPEEALSYGADVDKMLSQPGEINKPVLVIVRRAPGVDYQQRPDDGSHPFPRRWLTFEQLLEHKNSRVQDLGDERIFDQKRVDATPGELMFWKRAEKTLRSMKVLRGGN